MFGLEGGVEYTDSLKAVIRANKLFLKISLTLLY